MKGEYKPKFNQTPLLFGNYLHSFFESKKAHKDFVDANKNSFYKYGKKKNGLKTCFKQADKCIHTLCQDSGFKALYQGKREVIVTGVIDGVKWMGKIDCLNLERNMFLDLKTVDDIHKKHWNESLHQYVDFTIDRGYDVQMAIYQELIKQTFGVECKPYIVAISKQEIPDKAIIGFENSSLQDALNDVRMRQDRIQHVINGELKPKSCGKCEYCRQHKNILDMKIETAGQIELY